MPNEVQSKFYKVPAGLKNTAASTTESHQSDFYGLFISKLDEYTKDKDFDEIQANVMILVYLNKNEYITRKEVERLCGFSPATSKRILKDLREQEKIVLEGQLNSVNIN